MNKISTYLLIVVVWYFLPVLSIFMLLFFLRYTNIKHIKESIFLIFLLSLSIGLISYTQGGTVGKQYDSDIERYYTVYNQFSGMDFDTFMGTRFLSNPNVIFDLITYFLSQIWSYRPQILSLFWMTVSYFFGSLSLLLFLKNVSINFSPKFLPFLLFLYIFIFSNYTFSSDLIKQSVATSLIIFSIVLKIRNQNLMAFILALIAIFVHSSALILSPIFLFFNVLKNYKAFYSILIIGVWVILSNLNQVSEILFSFQNSYLISLAEKAAIISEEKTGWSIHYLNTLLLMLLLIMIVFSWYLLRQLRYSTVAAKLPKNIYNSVISIQNVSILSFILLIINYSNVHNFLRYLNTYSVFYLLPIIIIHFHSRISIKQRLVDLKRLLSFSYIIFFSFYSFLNFYHRTIDIERSYGTTIMNNDLLLIFTSNVSQFLSFQ